MTTLSFAFGEGGYKVKLLGDALLVDECNEAHPPAAAGATQHIYGEDPAQKRCPIRAPRATFRTGTEGQVDGRFRFPGDNKRSQFGVAGKNSVVAREVLPLRGHEGGDALKELHEMTLFDWMSQWRKPNHDDQFVRGTLGRMLFSADDFNKQVKVCSGGEKNRLLFGKLIMMDNNVLIMDEPTNHLDMDRLRH